MATEKNTKKNSVRIPPQNLDSEKAVLGSIMLRKEAMHEVEDVISPDSFYADKHKIIFQAMLDLFLKNEPIDMLSLSIKLNEKKSFRQNRGQSISSRNSKCSSLFH